MNVCCRLNLLDEKKVIQSRISSHAARDSTAFGSSGRGTFTFTFTAATRFQEEA